jgi:aminomethyltransferase
MSACVLAAIADVDVAALRYFRVTSGTIVGVPVDISRTGYTGDLGYEIWIPRDAALTVWDAVVRRGRDVALKPAGMLALDMARVEAGLLLIDVDYHSSRKATIPSQRYTPYELGLGRLVSLDKAPFVGRDALADAFRRGPQRQIVGLEIEWSDVEALHERVGLVPTAPASASRTAVPVFMDGRQVGRVTTTAWSPTLKKLLALATIDAPHFVPGARVRVEVTVNAVRHTAAATVVPTPFFNPPRKIARPDFARLV